MDYIARATRRTLVASLALIVVGVCTAALTWACTPAANLSVSPATGPAGSQVVVDGSMFAPGPVEIRWGGAGGQVLATTVGATFAVNVTIPAAPPGAYTIVAVGRDGSGAVAGQSAAAFTIPTPAGGPDRPPAAPPGVASGTASGAQSVRAGESSRTVSGGAVVRRSEAAGSTASARAPAKGGPVFAGSLAPSRPSAASGGAARPAQLSERAAASDLWSGFDSSGARAGLGRDAGNAAGGGVPALTLALLVLGSIAAVAGAGAALAGRRRAPARR